MNRLPPFLVVVACVCLAWPVPAHARPAID